MWRIASEEGLLCRCIQDYLESGRGDKKPFIGTKKALKQLVGF